MRELAASTGGYPRHRKRDSDAGWMRQPDSLGPLCQQPISPRWLAFLGFLGQMNLVASMLFTAYVTANDVRSHANQLISLNVR